MKRRILAIGLSATAVLAGCGDDGGNTSANAIEQAIKDQTGSSVDISVDSSNNGKIKITTDTGSVEMGSSSDLPDDFPKDVPLPDLKLVTSYAGTSGAGNEKNFVLTFESKSAKNDFNAYVDELKSKGFTAGDTASGTQDEAFFGFTNAVNDAWKLDIAAAGQKGDEPGTITVAVTPKAESS